MMAPMATPAVSPGLSVADAAALDGFELAGADVPDVPNVVGGDDTCDEEFVASGVGAAVVVGEGVKPRVVVVGVVGADGRSVGVRVGATVVVVVVGVDVASLDVGARVVGDAVVATVGVLVVGAFVSGATGVGDDVVRGTGEAVRYVGLPVVGFRVGLAVRNASYSGNLKLGANVGHSVYVGRMVGEPVRNGSHAGSAVKPPVEKIFSQYCFTVRPS